MQIAYSTSPSRHTMRLQCELLIMISRTSVIPDLNKYATKTMENDCFVDREGRKLCLSYLLAVISEKMFACYVFPDKNQKPLRMCRMQIIKQAVAILSLISGNGIRIYLVRTVDQNLAKRTLRYNLSGITI